MAHHVYQSPAFVLGGTNVGDANKFIDLFTRELGLVKAAAQSVRAERSKLRYSLQTYTYGDVSLVRGKEVWRVTGAVEDFNIYHKLKSDKQKFVLFHNVTLLLRRLIQGEEQNKYIFDVLSSFVEELIDEKSEIERLKGIEYITVLRILYSLGYIKKKGDLYESVEYMNEDVEKIYKGREETLAEINCALKRSHL
jgi:DNA repair protein RecO